MNQTIEGLLLLAKAEAAQPGTARTSFSLVELTGEILSVLEVLVEEQQIIPEQRGQNRRPPSSMPTGGWYEQPS